MDQLIQETPDGWRGLQTQAARILTESGFTAEAPKTINLARGTVEVDVYAQDPEQAPPTVYLCECKFWKRCVSKGAVHAFRTVVTDLGANWGLIVSSLGFQSGAHAAAAHSNVRLVTWPEFQALFVDRWYERYFVTRMRDAADPLWEYTEPINSRISRKADRLPLSKQQAYAALRRKHHDLAYFAFPFVHFRDLLKDEERRPPLLPVRGRLPVESYPAVPDQVLDATLYRTLLEAYCHHAAAAVAEFDDVFGERA